MAEGPVDKLTAHVVQNYQITGEISRDAMSRLYQATSPSLGSAVIIQVIPGELARDREFPDRFQSRMRKAASLAHRNIIHINHFVREEPNYYLVLDYFDGRALSEMMDAAPLPVRPVMNLLSQALEALDHAHKNGIAHGALHPGGMLVAEDGELRLTGFGVAKAIDPQSMLVETPNNPYPYKSPEQIMGLPVDARSDIYSLGLIVWQALTARLPQGEDIPAPSTVNPDISPELEDVIMRMLVARPRDRFRTARQVAIALSAALRAQGRAPAEPGRRRAPARVGAATPDLDERLPGPESPSAPSPSPAATGPRSEEGIEAYRKGNVEDAVRLLEEAAEAMPRSVRVLGYLGAAYYSAKRYSDAVDALSRALDVRPDLATLRYNLGNALLAQGKVADAKAEFQKAWDQDPRCTSALLMLVSLEGVSRR